MFSRLALVSDSAVGAENDARWGAIGAPHLQSKLLKVIEDKRVRRLGAVTERVVDVKLTAATQVELSTLVQDGRFRADLYHRLSVVLLTVPPLRERREDIHGFAQLFLARYAAAHRLHPKRLSTAAEAWLQGYD